MAGGSRPNVYHPAVTSSPLWVVLGMHRSGTSLLMNLFERLGFHLGGNDDFHPATAHDPEGYREHIAVWGLNEKILAAGDAAWDEPLVRECHMLNGEIDFILKCVAPDLSTFQNL